MTAIEKLISIAEAEIGYLEKKSNSQLESKTANAGSANYTKYWQDIKSSYQGQPWCACFVTWCFVQAFGAGTAARLLKHYPYVYCPTMAELFTLHANPQKGDIVIFKRNGTFVHTGLVTYVNGDYFETIEGNTSGGSTIIANGGGVCRKSYYNSNLPGTKFCRPDYSILNDKEKLTMTQYEELKQKIGAIGDEIKSNTARISNLERPDMVYNYIDDNMPEWARAGVQWCVDKGIVKGTGEGLGLTDEKLWICVVLYRIARNVYER